MACPSRIKRYHVFPSFHGPDVRKGFLSHLHNHFAIKGITTFKDQEIQRGYTIGPELVQAIRELRVSIVLLSKNYASSSWCLDELVEILRCRGDQMVMTIFYDVDPSDVRKQKGDFGSAFEKTCEGRTEKEKQRWVEALAYVAIIAGEHSLNWTDEAAMVEKFANDVSNKLNVTVSRDFDGMVGLQTHLRKLSTLLCLDCDDVKMTGIRGPAGIGKSTIARALYNLLSGEFWLRCFMGNLKRSDRSVMGVDDYDSKLWLQSQLLSKILNQRDMKVHHLGAIKEWLQDQKVLIILDDVDDLVQLEVLAKEPFWFGPGSRVIVTTKDRMILKARDINEIYHVDFPSDKEALEILSVAAFRQNSVRDGFEDLANEVVKLCSKFPLGLCVVGSSLRGENKHEWELQLSRIRTSLPRKIQDILKVGYDRLLKKYQVLFLHIACFFNKNCVDRVTSMLADSNQDVENGLKTLASQSLVQIDTCTHTVPNITMHCLIQQLGRHIVYEQSDEAGKRQFLLEAEEIRNVLANETGTGSVIGISFDMSKIGEFSISGRAFEGMRNLLFLRFYDGNVMHTLGDITYLPHLRLLQWSSYPGKHLPLRFQPECLVELHMVSRNLEKLWGGIQTLASLKEIDMSDSHKLKEIPNLSKAANLHELKLNYCTSLVELPSSFRNLHKLVYLEMQDCRKLRVIPPNINLASLKRVDMSGCLRLSAFPDFSSNIKFLNIRNTSIEDVPAYIARNCLLLDTFLLGSRSFKKLTHVPECVTCLDLSNSDIKTVPDCVIDLPHISELFIQNCRKLVSLHNLPPSLWRLSACDCGLLKSVSFYDLRSSIIHNGCVELEKEAIRGSSYRKVTLHNCFSLDQETRRAIMQRWNFKCAYLPGNEIPAEFVHKATGNSITISSRSLSTSSRFKACLLLSPGLQTRFGDSIICCLSSNGVTINRLMYHESSKPPHGLLREHLLVFCGGLFDEQRCLKVTSTSEIQFEFFCAGNDDKIMNCGVQILAEGVENSITKTKEQSHRAAAVSKDESVVKSSKYTGPWSWLRKLL